MTRMLSVLVSSFLGLVPQAILACSVFYFFESSGKHLGTIVVVFLGLELLLLVNWTFSSIFQWFLHWGFNKEKMAESFLDLFIKDNFPEPYDHNVDLNVWLPEIRDGENNTIQARFRAAEMIAQLDAFRALGMLQHVLMLSFALEEAAKRYKRYKIRSVDR